MASWEGKETLGRGSHLRLGVTDLGQGYGAADEVQLWRQLVSVHSGPFAILGTLGNVFSPVPITQRGNSSLCHPFRKTMWARGFSLCLALDSWGTVNAVLVCPLLARRDKHITS